MSPQERRGKWLFSLLAAIVMCEMITTISLTFLADLELPFKLGRFISPVCGAFLLYLLWRGQEWWRFALGVRSVSNGLFLGLITMTRRGPETLSFPGDELLLQHLVKLPVFIVWLYVTLSLATGISFVFSPGVLAWLRLQRSRFAAES